MSETLLNNIESDNSLLSRIITGDESWVFKYDPFTKCQTMQWKTRKGRHKKNKNVLLAAKGNNDSFFKYSRCCYNGVSPLPL